MQVSVQYPGKHLAKLESRMYCHSSTYLIFFIYRKSANGSPLYIYVLTAGSGKGFRVQEVQKNSDTRHRAHVNVNVLSSDKIFSFECMLFLNNCPK